LNLNGYIDLEVSNPAKFMVSGNCHVIVGLKEQDKNQFNSTFMVIIPSC